MITGCISTGSGNAGLPGWRRRAARAARTRILISQASSVGLSGRSRDLPVHELPYRKGSFEHDGTVTRLKKLVPGGQVFVQFARNRIDKPLFSDMLVWADTPIFESLMRGSQGRRMPGALGKLTDLQI